MKVDDLTGVQRCDRITFGSEALSVSESLGVTPQRLTCR